MKKAGVNHEILHLLVSVYNQSIQTYYHFPEVILCGRQRLEPDAFTQLLASEFITPVSADSFGRNYRLSKKGEDFLFTVSFRRRQKPLPGNEPRQRRFPFAEIMEA